MASRATAPRRRRLLRIAAVVGGLLVLYTGLGFLVAPAVLRRLLERKGSEALHRPVAVERVRVNPLALSVTVDGLSVHQRDGAPFVAWESLYVRAAPLRVFTGDVGVAEIRLVRPTVNAGLRADGSLSFQDLVAPSSSSPSSAPPPEQQRRGRLGLYVGHLAIVDARIVFHDATRHPAFQGVVGPFTVGLESFRTKGGGDSPYRFEGTTDAGETFRWTGAVRTEPVRSTGTLTFEQVKLPRYDPYERAAAPAEIRSGQLDVAVGYEVEWGPARHVLRLHDGKIAVRDLVVSPRGEPDPPVRLPHLAVSGIEVDAVARTASVAEVALQGAALRVRRDADGGLELAQMAPPPRRRVVAPDPGKPWRWSVGAVAISDAALTWEDRVPATAVRLALTAVNARLEGLRPGADATSPLSLALAWPAGGKVEVSGKLRPFGKAGTLDVQASGLDLVPLAPYLQPTLAAQLAGGQAGARLTVGVDASAPAPRWTVAGDLRVDGLALAEQGNPALFHWRALEVTGVDAGSAPPHATVREVRLLDPRVKLYVWGDGSNSLTRARPATSAPPPAKDAPAKDAPAKDAPAKDAPAKDAPAKDAPGPAWQTAIGLVQVSGGKVTVVDRTLSPPAVLQLTRAGAMVRRLSSDPRVRSSADVLLELQGSPPIRVRGTLNPLQHEAYTDLAVSSQGVDLTPFDPYAGKYLGYGLERGKLDLDLRYRVEKRRLKASNVVRLDQLTLGEETHSPDATKLPVRLGLAILKDKDGVINLDVPVEGNLDDPKFHLGKVIWHTIGTVLVKAGTSPFRALAALGGGDGQQELSQVEFRPGTSELDPGSTGRLEALAKSLAQRPGLALEVEGSVDQAKDGEALRRAALDRTLRHAKALAARSPPASEDELTITPAERPALVRAVYAAAFPAGASTGASTGAGAPEDDAAAERSPGARGALKASAPAPGPSPEEMEARLAETAEVPPDAFTALAAERAQRARDALVQAGVDQSRLFLAHGGARATKEKGARVYFEVR